MKKKILIIILLSIISKFGAAQIFDKYGFYIGTSYSNQLWDYKLISVDNPNKEYKIGLSVFLSAERKINKQLSIRPEIGYIQKGFKNDMEFTSYDGTPLGTSNKSVIFHDFGFNIGLKIAPFNLKFSPYALLGLQSSFMFSYKDIIFVENVSGLEFNIYRDKIDKFNKFNLGGIIGIGLELNNLTYLEFAYNPPLTNSYNDASLRIKDNSMELKLGFNINKLVENK
ncbi:MAG: outer membrane beta-barrel protein [Paludibacter sp.]